MADILLSPALYLVLTVGATVFTVITVLRQRLLWAVPAALCCICACLLGLAAGRSLEQILITVLIPLAVMLLSQTAPEGGGGT